MDFCWAQNATGCLLFSRTATKHCKFCYKLLALPSIEREIIKECGKQFFENFLELLWFCIAKQGIVDESLGWSHSQQTSKQLAHEQTWQSMQDGPKRVSKVSKCNSCMKRSRNLKSKITFSEWGPAKYVMYQMKKYKIFRGPIDDEKNQELYFLECIDWVYIFFTAELFYRVNAKNGYDFTSYCMAFHEQLECMKRDVK